MNAAGDNVEKSGEAAASTSTSEQNGERLTNNPTNNTPHNDCGKICDPTLTGARPKVIHICNIPNGILPTTSEDDGVKVNNNLPVVQAINAIAECSTSYDQTSGSRLNGLHYNRNSELEPINGVDSYLRNNVNCRTAVDKCPLKVRECSDSGNEMSSHVPRVNGCCNVDQLETQEHRSLRWNDNDSSSSDTGNEAEDGLSGDECCIYTYKGDQMADLPSSFFRLEAGGPEPPPAAAGDNEANNSPHNSRSSSPEMDFLEMDFDPGPSCEQDSEEDSERGSLRDEEAEILPEIQHVENGNGLDDAAKNDLSTGPSHSNDLGSLAAVGLPRPASATPEEQPQVTTRPPLCPPLSLPYSRNTETNLGTAGQRTTWDVWGHHCTSGDLCSPGESTTVDGEAWNEGLGLLSPGSSRPQGEGTDARKSNLHSALYHCIMAKRLVLNKHASFGDEEEGDGATSKPAVERTMIWSEREACVKQVTQISTSACGATAVINVMLAMNMTADWQRVNTSVGTRLRARTAPLAEYLLSRSVAGASHIDIMRGLEQEGIYARFFPMFPQPGVQLSCWLAHWMRKGAIPIATLNLQRGLAPDSLIPDAWHHQMVFGVGVEGVYLTNPLEFVSEATLWPQLSSPSVLLVRRTDVIERWTQDTDLKPLATQSDVAWKRLNVLGQVVNVIREWTSPAAQGRVMTQHVMIPAGYSSGITLAIGRENPACDELRHTSNLA